MDASRSSWWRSTSTSAAAESTVLEKLHQGTSGCDAGCSVASAVRMFTPSLSLPGDRRTFRELSWLPCRRGSRPERTCSRGPTRSKKSEALAGLLQHSLAHHRVGERLARQLMAERRPVPVRPQIVERLAAEIRIEERLG